MALALDAPLPGAKPAAAPVPAPAPARTPPAAWAPPRLPHACWSDPARLTRAIRGARGGVLILTGAPRAAPFASIASLFDSVTPDIAARANAAYGGGGMGGAGGGARLVWKDAYGEGRGGPNVDAKRVIDLSPHRMEHLTSVDPGLAEELGAPLADALSFFGDAAATAAPAIVVALRGATGCGHYCMEEARLAYRMVDYGAHPTAAAAAAAPEAGAPPRCGSHRDFGTATLIWSNEAGLEIRVGDEWHMLPRLAGDEAVLLFGLCTAWRSNDRVRAAEHRVSAAPVPASGGPPPRRLSAVLFLGLGDDAPLEPALLSPSEAPRYKPARAGAVHPVVRRKWSWREGSVTVEERAEEEAERRRYPTQESLIKALYKLA